MKRTISIIAFALCVCGALGASAQGQGKGGEINDVTEYTFPDEAVVGDQHGPDGTVVWGDRKPKTRSLIKVRSNFVRAMLKSVEDI